MGSTVPTSEKYSVIKSVGGIIVKQIETWDNDFKEAERKVVHFDIPTNFSRKDSPRFRRYQIFKSGTGSVGGDISSNKGRVNM